MNSKERIAHELYQRKVVQLNEVVAELNKRQARCSYLQTKHQAAAKVWNIEQAEAYEQRILQHQKPIDELAKNVIRLRSELEQMPRVWIA